MDPTYNPKVLVSDGLGLNSKLITTRSKQVVEY